MGCKAQRQGDRKGVWTIQTQDRHQNSKICVKSVEGHQQKIHGDSLTLGVALWRAAIFLPSSCLLQIRDLRIDGLEIIHVENWF